jgi:serine/threonine-protein kinase
MTELTAGHVIAGRYRLVQRLGQGGMGSVWSAEHLELRSKVAVKLIVPRYANDPDMLSRFVREARAAAALRSPHVVQIFDSGLDEGLAFIAMEQLEGESLAARLDREHTLSPKLTATVVTHVARAITRAHEANLVHRDLKPENIFLVQNEDELVAKVLDFGIAKVLAGEDGEPPSTRTETGKLVGSPYYMSPEQARGRDVDFRSDLWAIGVLAYECLIGKRPFTGISLGEIILAICTEPEPVPSKSGPVPEGFDAWFARATARDPNQRFQSARELSAALRRSLSPDSGVVSDPAEGLTGVTPAVTPRSVEASAMGTTTGEPTSSDAKPAQPAKPQRLRYWPVVATAAAAVVAATLGLRPHGAPNVAPAPRSEHAAQSPQAIAPAAPVAPAPAAPAASVAPAQSSQPATTPPTPASPSAPSVPSAISKIRARSAKAAVAPAASAPAKVVKDPLSTRF